MWGSLHCLLACLPVSRGMCVLYRSSIRRYAFLRPPPPPPAGPAIGHGLISGCQVGYPAVT